MKSRIAKLTVLAVILLTAVSGCASLSLQPSTEAKIPVGPDSSALDIQFGVARLLERNGKLEEARRGYLEILSLQSHAPSLHRLGVTAIRQNRLDAGLKHLSKAIAAGKPSAELLGDYGYAQLLSGDLSAAELTLKDAISLDPSEKRNINNLAIAIGKQDRLRESYQLFRQVNNESEALANLAFLQAQAEDLNKAKANYNRALELDPELEIAAIGLLEVHNHLESYGVVHPNEPQYSDEQLVSQSPVHHSPQPSARPVQATPQHPPRPQRIASSPVRPTRVAPAPQQSTNSADRVLAAIKRPVQLPGRAPAKNKSSRITRPKRVAQTLGSGALQPPSFSERSTGVVLQASYEEAISQPPPEN